MKINEIAYRHLNEANPVVKYVGPYFDKAAAAAAKLFGAGKGTTQAELDALRAGETGAAKAAGERPLSTVSKDELNALLYPPVTPAPTVGSFLKRRGDQGFDPDLSKPQALPGYLQNLPPARIVPVTRPSPSGPRPRPRPAAELGNMEPPLQSSTAAAELGQVRPGVETSTSAAAPAASDTVNLPRDLVDRIMRMAERDPAAAQQMARDSGWRNYPLTGGVLGTTIGAVGGTAGINAMNGVSNAPEVKITPWKPTDTEEAPPAAPAAPIVDKTDPRVQELLKQLEKNGKLDESTAALTRMVYLSRL